MSSRRHDMHAQKRTAVSSRCYGCAKGFECQRVPSDTCQTLGQVSHDGPCLALPRHYCEQSKEVDARTTWKPDKSERSSGWGPTPRLITLWSFFRQFRSPRAVAA